MYTTRELEVNEVPCLGVVLDDYPSTTFVVGGVQLLEENQTLKIKFDYNIIEGPTPANKNKFEFAVGKFIEHFIESNPGQLVYTGGT